MDIEQWVNQASWSKFSLYACCTLLQHTAPAHHVLCRTRTDGMNMYMKELLSSFQHMLAPITVTTEKVGPWLTHEGWSRYICHWQMKSLSLSVHHAVAPITVSIEEVGCEWFIVELTHDARTHQIRAASHNVQYTEKCHCKLVHVALVKACSNYIILLLNLIVHGVARRTHKG